MSNTRKKRAFLVAHYAPKVPEKLLRLRAVERPLEANPAPGANREHFTSRDDHEEAALTAEARDEGRGYLT